MTAAHQIAADTSKPAMKRTVTALTISALAWLAVSTASAQAPRKPPTPAQAIRGNFANLNKEVLAMAKDFPEDKYDYRPGKDVRSFGEVIIHIVSGNVFGAKAGKGENVKWDELDPKDYKTKAEMVAALEKSIDDATATLKAAPDDKFKETLFPWMAVIEHEAEHFGQLNAYYRVNGLVPPQSRPQPKSNE